MVTFLVRPLLFDYVFPTYMGVILSTHLTGWGSLGIPHVYGGDPW